MARADRFLRACRRQPTDATPIWLMRQAGRYLPEYQRLKQQYSILELVKNSDLAVEITLQPVHAFEVDAAIIFADILPLLEGMGLRLRFVEGNGPVIDNPLREPVDIDALAIPAADEAFDFTMRAIRSVRQSLAGKVPLIGFSGAPFTLACYAVEGRSSKDFASVKRLLYNQPRMWHRLLEKLAAAVANYARCQIAAGAQAIQLFDSWAGLLSPHDYHEYVLPHVRRVIGGIKEMDVTIPVIYFGTGTAGYLPLFKQAGCDVLGVDWRISLSDAWAQVGDDLALQGNLDPAVLQAPLAEVRRQAACILDDVKGRNGHIFNLGHGVTKETPVEAVGELVNFVHEYTRNGTMGA